MKLSELVGRPSRKRLFAVVYGTAGVGKSTFAAHFDKPLFQSLESGLGEVEGPDGQPPEELPTARNFDELLSNADLVIDDAGATCGTYVLDTLDAAQRLCEADILRTTGAPSMAEACGGFGKAYDRLSASMAKLAHKCETMAKSGIAVVVLAHVKRHKVECPVNGPYERYGPKVHEKVWPPFHELASLIGFASRNVVVSRNEGGDARRVADKGATTLQLIESAAAVAKNRYGLPASIPFGYASFAAAMAEAQQKKGQK